MSWEGLSKTAVSLGVKVASSTSVCSGGLQVFFLHAQITLNYPYILYDILMLGGENRRIEVEAFTTHYV